VSVRRIPVRYPALLRDWLAGQGVDTGALLRLAGIDEARFDRDDATLAPCEMEAFVGSARRLTGRGDLGFELGRLIKMTSHGLLGYGMLSCPTIDEVMRLVARHYLLMTETFTLRYLRNGTVAGVALYAPAMAMPREMLDFYLEVLAIAHDNQLRLMLGPAGGAYDVHIGMAPPPHLARYRRLAPTRFHFDAAALPGIRVVMDATVLAHRLPLADARVVQDVDRRCLALGRRAPATSHAWLEHVRMLLGHCDGPLPTLDSIARLHQVSSRPPDRHLRRGNTSFRGLSQEVRIERARRLLEDPALPVAQVAARLGFSDPANFSRAFRRAVGLTPSAYRQTLLASADMPG